MSLKNRQILYVKKYLLLPEEDRLYLLPVKAIAGKIFYRKVGKPFIIETGTLINGFYVLHIGHLLAI